MRRILATILFVLGVAVLLAGCGGGGGSSDAPSTPPPIPAPQSQTYTDYAPHGYSTTRNFKGGQWQSTVKSDTEMWLRWGTTQEEFRVLPYEGEQWVMLMAYRNLEPPARYEISASRIEIDRHDGNGWQKLIPVTANPYVPVKVTGKITVRQWGWVAGELPYFWQSTFTPLPAVYNACWLGVGDSTRPVIRQQEVWWDKTGGTIRGTLNLGPDGEPDGTGIVYEFYQDIAFNAGHLWTSSTGQCAIN